MKRNSSNQHRRRPQKGIALLTVMSMFAIMAIIGAGFFASQTMSLKRTANHLNYIQSCQYALAGEEIAKQVLWQDWDKEENGGKKKHYDGKNDLWSREISVPALDAIGSGIAGEIIDLHRKFNLNNLYVKDGKGELKKIGESVEWKQLDAIFKDEGLDEKLIYNLYDWMDKDDVPDPNAVDTEDEGYMGLEVPYRTANFPLQHLSELRLIKDFGIKEYQKLLPHLVLLPESGTKINVNTADAEVIARLFDADAQNVEELIAEEGGEKGFEEIGDFTSVLANYLDTKTSIWTKASVGPHGEPADPPRGVPEGTANETQGGVHGGETATPDKYLSVSSEYFEVRVRAIYDERQCDLISLLHRNPETGKVYLLSRNYTERVEFEKEKSNQPENESSASEN